jgi:hypothetical protein
LLKTQIDKRLDELLNNNERLNTYNNEKEKNEKIMELYKSKRKISKKKSYDFLLQNDNKPNINNINIDTYTSI